jgi:hypothetical protein
MNAPSLSDYTDINAYLHEMANFLAAATRHPSGALSAHRLLLARIIPDMTQEEWEALAARHGLHDWHALPLPADSPPPCRAAPIMVRADEKKFLFSGSM